MHSFVILCETRGSSEDVFYLFLTIILGAFFAFALPVFEEIGGVEFLPADT